MNPILDNRLMEAFKFQRDDLEANQQERFSAAQQRDWDALRAHSESAANNSSTGASVLMLVALILVVMGVITGILAFTGVLTQLIDSLGVYLLPAAGVVALLMGLVLRAGMNAQRASIAMVAQMGDPNQQLPAVQRIVGFAQTVQEVSRRRTGNDSFGRTRTDYFLIVGDAKRTIRMRIGEGGMGAFEPGHQYAVYYYESWGVPAFLSAEALN